MNAQMNADLGATSRAAQPLADYALACGPSPDSPAQAETAMNVVYRRHSTRLELNIFRLITRFRFVPEQASFLRPGQRGRSDLRPAVHDGRFWCCIGMVGLCVLIDGSPANVANLLAWRRGSRRQKEVAYSPGVCPSGATRGPSCVIGSSKASCSRARRPASAWRNRVVDRRCCSTILAQRLERPDAVGRLPMVRVFAFAMGGGSGDPRFSSVWRRRFRPRAAAHVALKTKPAVCVSAGTVRTRDSCKAWSWRARSPNPCWLSPGPGPSFSFRSRLYNLKNG